MGGHGVRQASSLALPVPAYLASAASTASLQNNVLEGATSSDMLATYLSKWQSGQL